MTVRRLARVVRIGCKTWTVSKKASKTNFQLIGTLRLITYNNNANYHTFGLNAVNYRPGKLGQVAPAIISAWR